VWGVRVSGWEELGVAITANLARVEECQPEGKTQLQGQKASWENNA